MAQERPEPSNGSADHAAQLLNLAYDAIFTRGFRGREIRYWNRAAEQLYGYPADVALGRLPAELLLTRYPQPLDEIEWELLATGRWEGELMQTDSKGRELVIAGRWALLRDPSGEPLEILEINRDVTESKLAERRLRESEERFRLLIENVREYAIFMLDPRGFVSSWNVGAQRIKGYSAREIIGKHFSVFYTPEDVLAGKPGRALAIAETEGSYQTEAQRVRKDGSRFWADVLLSALRDDRGLLRGYAKVTRDVTDRRAQQERELEMEREHARRFREHAERVQALERTKSNFLNLVSHELRTPLGILKGYLSMIEDGTLGRVPPRLAGTIPTLHRSVGEMSTLVEELLELARIEDRRLQLRKQRLDAVSVVVNVVDRFRTLNPERSVDFTPPEAAILVDIDQDRISVIIENLLRNAVTYSPEGGEISVELKLWEDSLLISVSDRGIGIAPQHLGQLFTRFGRIETAETAAIQGTGLGLYLSRELARLHGGDITVESKLGEGSTFTLSLPLASASGPLLPDD